MAAGGHEVEEKKEKETYVRPPDGGWGWMVVLSSFLIHVIADGIVYSFGVFLPVFVEYFGSGRGETSWVGSLQPAVTFTVGPLASALTNRYGCRVVTIAGAVVCAAGFVLSVFTPNLYLLYFTSGIMAGLGFGLIYLPAIVSVAQYFEKRRSFATGLAVCGSGFGTFLFAPFTEYLHQEYSWRGAMLILGGIILNVVVCGAIFRPLEASVSLDEEEEEEEGEGEGNREESGARGDKQGGQPPSPEARALLSKVQANGRAVKASEVAVELANGDHGNVDPDLDLHLDLDLGKAGNGDSAQQHRGRHVQMAPEWLKNRLSPPPTANGLQLPPANPTASIAKSDGALHHMDRTRVDSMHAQLRRVRQEWLTSGRPVVGRKDVFYSGSLHNIPLFRSHHDLYITSIASIPNAVAEEGREESKCCGLTVPAEFSEAFREMMDLSLLRNPVFLMFAVSNFFTSIGFNMPFIFLPDRAKLSGIDEVSAAWLLSAIGIANTLGRVVFGFMADLRWVNRLMLYNTALTICGVATALSPFVGGNYELLLTYAAVFGIFIGVYVSLTSVVLVDLLGIDKLTNSFGLLLLFQGAATFIGPPLAGWMCDWTGSYDISFNVMGALIALSGAMLYLLPFVQRRYERQTPPDQIVLEVEMGKQTTDPDIQREAEEQLLHARRPRKTSF